MLAKRYLNSQLLMQTSTMASQRAMFIVRREMPHYLIIECKNSFLLFSLFFICA
jgi:hypothetical protein